MKHRTYLVATLLLATIAASFSVNNAFTTDDATSLSSLKVSTGYLSPAFDSNKQTYNVQSIESDIIDITATATVSDSSVSGTGRKNLSCGNNAFPITVTAKNGSKRIYNIYAYKTCSPSKPEEKEEQRQEQPSEHPTEEDTSSKDSNSSLSSLTITNTNLTFDKNNYEYNTSVSYETEGIEVNAKAESDKASIEIQKPDKLEVGENNITIVVTAENGSKSTYKIKITRQEEEKESINDTLIGLIINDQYFIISDNKTSFDIEIDKAISRSNIVAIPNKESSTVTISSNNDVIGDKDKVRIAVTSEDGSVVSYVLTFSFPYKTITEDETRPGEVQYWLIAVIAAVAAIIIGLLIFLMIKAKNNNQKNAQTFNQPPISFSPEPKIPVSTIPPRPTATIQRSPMPTPPVTTQKTSSMSTIQKPMSSDESLVPTPVVKPTQQN